jgi:hypothetical protein
MKRKLAVLIGGGVLLLTSFALFAPRGNNGVSKISIGFAGYSVVDGKRTLNLIVTNNSPYRITQPGGRYELRGESPDGRMISMGVSTTFCCFPPQKWGWWQLQLPKIPSVPPGATFQFSIPVDEQPYTWHVTVPFTTISFRDRLPFALRSRWPSSKRDTSISFEVSSPPIPPQAQKLSAVSAVDRGKIQP